MVATDISAAALDVARANAAAPRRSADRIEFRETRYLDGVDGPFDLIVSNPPYVTDGEYAGPGAGSPRSEPRSALTAGADGLDDIRAGRCDVAATQPRRPAARLLIEMGHRAGRQRVPAWWSRNALRALTA